MSLLPLKEEHKPQPETSKQKLWKAVWFLISAIGLAFAIVLPIMVLILFIQWLIKLFK